MFLINFICEKRIFIDPLNENKNLFNKTKKIDQIFFFFGFKDPELEKSKSFSICVSYLL